ncbi:hypothetical protein [Psychroflexus sp. MES1-P1E]|uniref:hypothetical protein n=1 Tax=Psychroflexus sp. MES1-P1E TaxID=2058320 RepID=UPI000C7B98B2|nr:hypothetical protein [Psychroflexus sp. MES1-P1E]PKG42523.1 hypothetical protein CXF67_09840 [Psychroflexus sp. MES1-P1E]
MKRYLFFLIVIVFSSCSEYKGDKNSVDYDSVEITFDGYGDYEIDGKLKISITNPLEVEQLNLLKNQSQRKWFANLKSTEFFMRLVYKNSNTGEQLLMSISKSTDFSPTIEYGSGTLFDGKYKNNEFVSYISNLTKLDSIKNHK